MNLNQASKLLKKYDWALSITYDSVEDTYSVYVGDDIENPIDCYDDYDQVILDWSNSSYNK